MKKVAKALPVRKKSGAKKTSKAKVKAPRRQFVKPRTNAPIDNITSSKPRFVYVEARRFEDDNLITFDSIEVQGARDEAEAYTFGAAQLDTRQQANNPDENPHLLATPANDYVVTL